MIGQDESPGDRVWLARTHIRVTRSDLYLDLGSCLETGDLDLQRAFRLGCSFTLAMQVQERQIELFALGIALIPGCRFKSGSDRDLYLGWGLAPFRAWGCGRRFDIGRL
jgi:hypothetical protein